MAEPAALKYRAFISYSHVDTSWAKWLHRGLEGFRIDKDLVGRETALGAIPKTLRPIFRDRDDFTAGHTLTEQTLAALDASHVLIVICSPASAKSHYVNEEIRLFKSRHPQRLVIPLIVAGKPGDAQLECFPSSLRYRLDSAGQITEEPAELLAADAREDGDGRNLALAKVVAGLLDVSSDEVFRRAERERRRKLRLRNGVIAGLAVLTIAASSSAVYAWQQLKTNQAFLTATLKTATEIVDATVAQAENYGVPRAATLALLAQAEGLFDNMALLGRSTPELRYQKAWMLIHFARNYALLGDTGKWQHRAIEAHSLLVGLTSEKPGDPNYQRGLSAAQHELGDVLVARGNLAEALKVYRDSLDTAERFVKADPSSDTWQHALSVSYERLGDVFFAEGNLSEALASYQGDLTIRARLAQADPSNPDWLRDLSVAYEKVGNVLVARGNLPEAQKAYRDSLAIAELLARADPSNAQWQRDLSVTYNKLGDVLTAQGNLPEALRFYRDAVVIRDSLAATDPSNTGWQRDLSVSYNKVGDALSAENNLAEALKAYRDGLAIADQLVKADGSNAGWQRDLSVSYQKVGNVLLAQDNLPEALRFYRGGLAIAGRLAETDPANAEWQRDVAVGQWKVGMLLARQGETTKALGALHEGRGIVARLKQLSPDNAQLSSDIAEFDTGIAKLEQDDTLAVQPEQAAP